MPTLLILAAGMGSRYGGLKQLDPVGPHEQTILDYSIYDAIKAGFESVVFVIRKEIESAFLESLGSKYEDYVSCTYVHQELDALPSGYGIPTNRNKPLGTGHAVLICEKAINEPFSVINADDFYGRTAYYEMFRFLKDVERSATKSDYAMVGFPVQNTLSDHGTVSRGICEIDDSLNLVSITERTKVEKIHNGIRYQDETGLWHPIESTARVSMNCWAFTPSIFPHLKRLFRTFLDEQHNDPKAEFYLPSAIDHLIATNQAVVRVLSSQDRWVGITNPEDKPQVIDHLKTLIGEGVYPEKLW